MDTTTDLADARLARFLAEEPVIWLSTVRPDGTPHLVPTWFVWDGVSIVMMSKPGAQKVRNLRSNACAMLALGDAHPAYADQGPRLAWTLGTGVRGGCRAARGADRPVSISEPAPARSSLRTWLGEPLDHGLRAFRPAVPTARMPI